MKVTVFPFWYASCTDRIICKEDIAPLILKIEEEREHDDHEGTGDAGHHHQATVHHAYSLLSDVQRMAMWGDGEDAGSAETQIQDMES